MPPWEAEGLRHYLPPDEGRSENGTAPVHPAVMSPLLTWALRFTEDFPPRPQRAALTETRPG